MWSRLLPLLLATGLALPGWAQQVGDSAASVRAALGAPQMKRTTDAGEVWVYAGGFRVTMRDGAVAALQGTLKPAAATTPRVEYTKPAPAPNPRPALVRVQPETLVRVALPAPAPARPMPSVPKGAIALVLLGGLVACICNILILIAAFKESVWWGLGSIFVPFVSLVFIITHWAETKKPFLASLVASTVIVFTVLNSVSTVLASVPR